MPLQNSRYVTELKYKKQFDNGTKTDIIDQCNKTEDSNMRTHNFSDLVFLQRTKTHTEEKITGSGNTRNARWLNINE